MPNTSREPFVEGAIPLVSVIGKKKELLWNSGVRKHLEQHSKVAFVSVVGKARQGKSFLATRLLNLPKGHGGFKSTSTSEACTMGIWIYPRPLLINDTHVISWIARQPALAVDDDIQTS